MQVIPKDDPVRDQYEAYPYPRRDPAEERIRLLMRGPEYLSQINHFVFGGRQGFGPGSRILVAGGGTGDETIYIAEQLRLRGGEVVYLDQSLASMAIAKERAAIRGLTNIDFRHGRIEDVAIEVLGAFDYVHSIGVLHHIADPVLGLQKLAALLRPAGGMGLMLYGPHGRRGNYQLQSLAKLVFTPDQPLAARVREMVTIIEALPHGHPYFRGADRDAVVKLAREDPAELVDMVLHARDAPFSVGQIYDFLAAAGMTVVEFVPFAPNQAFLTNFTLFYDPRSYVTEPNLAARLSGMTSRQRHEIAELINGNMDLHCFYASRTAGAEADPAAADMVPFLLPLRSCFSFVENQLRMVDYAGTPYGFAVSKGFQLLFDLIDGERTVAEVIAEGYQRLHDAGQPMLDLRREFAELFTILRNFNWILLRHRSVPAFANLDHLYFSGAGWKMAAG